MKVRVWRQLALLNNSFVKSDAHTVGFGALNVLRDLIHKLARYTIFFHAHMYCNVNADLPERTIRLKQLQYLPSTCITAFSLMFAIR